MEPSETRVERSRGLFIHGFAVLAAIVFYIIGDVLKEHEIPQGIAKYMPFILMFVGVLGWELYAWNRETEFSNMDSLMNRQATKLQGILSGHEGKLSEKLMQASAEIGTRLKQEVAHAIKEQEQGLQGTVKEGLTAALGKADPMLQLQLLRGAVINQHLQLLLQKELEHYQEAYRAFNERKAFRIDTTRLYQYITFLTNRATKIDLLDQDIRRWRECVNQDGQPNTSTTFNYSRRILREMYSAATNQKGAKLIRMRRLFVVHETLFPEIFPDPRPDVWAKVPAITQSLLVIWQVEERVRAKRSLTDESFATRVFLVKPTRDAFNDGMLTRLKRFGDFVLIDEQLKLKEDIYFENQQNKVATTALETHSWVAEGMQDDAFLEDQQFFEELWNSRNTLICYDDDRVVPYKQFYSDSSLVGFVAELTT